MVWHVSHSYLIIRKVNSAQCRGLQTDSQLRWVDYYTINTASVLITISKLSFDTTFRSSSWAGVTSENTNMMMYSDVYITILLLQSRQISEMAGAACHEEVFQCPARWMSSTTEECHWGGVPRAGSKFETLATVRWTCAMYLGKFLEERAMSRKKDSGG